MKIPPLTRTLLTVPKVSTIESRCECYFLCAGDESFPEVAVRPPSSFVFSPHYCQFLYPNLGINNERNLGPIVTAKFQKDHDHTVLRITWEGNFRSVLKL